MYQLHTNRIQWGLLGAAFAGVGYAFSPLYRGLTFQFKVYVCVPGCTVLHAPLHHFRYHASFLYYLSAVFWVTHVSNYTSFVQMSFMTIGSMVEADQRLRAHEVLVRRDKKLKRDAEVWRRYQDEYVRRAVEESAKKGEGNGD